MFTTKKELPFLVMTKNGASLTLSVESVAPSEPVAFDDLFTTVDVSHVKPQEHSLAFCSRIIATNIANLTRRAVGNMLFVPDEDTKQRLVSMRIQDPLFKNILVHDSLSKNELRCAFWSVKDGKLVDGGIQISPNGFHCLPNYKSYFTRCFVL